MGGKALWIAVENGGRVKLSAGRQSYPQVFHNGLWKENWLFYNSLGRFYTFTQALFLLLFLKMYLKVISVRKRRERYAAGWQRPKKV
jgi:hypothetical protein